jgi:hypothetical protein
MTMSIHTINKLVTDQQRVNELTREIEIINDLAEQLSLDACDVTFFMQIHNEDRHKCNNDIIPLLGMLNNPAFPRMDPCTTFSPLQFCSFKEGAGLRFLHLMLTEKYNERDALAKRMENELITNKCFQHAER